MAAVVVFFSLGVQILTEEASWPEYLQGTFLLPSRTECWTDGLWRGTWSAQGGDEHHCQGKLRLG